ncbi:MAG TPA: BatD family protein, partial [Casimicrobiaceae bacterium]
MKFHATTLPETVFVGQQANYEVAVFVNSVVRDRLRRNPTFFPPDMQSMLAYDLPSRSVPPRHEGGSNCFDALVYQRALFPLMPGRFAIPPAQLVYSLPLSSSFFSREETHELQTDSTIIVAVEPPLAGRPAEYGGAVGRVRLSTKLDTSISRVGDPMLLTVKVSGTGNVKLFPRPTIGVPWASLVKGDERVDVDTTARRIAGSKEFDWVLTPKIAGELDIPPIRYGYFDPDARRYEVAATNPTHVRIGPGTLASADTARTETLLPLRTRYRGALGAPLHEHPAFWALLALAPIPALTLRGRDRRRRISRPAPSRAVRLGDVVKDAVSAQDATEVRRAFTSALAERVGLNSESFTRAGGLARALRRRGVSKEIALEAQQFLCELDEAAFARNGALPPDAAERAMGLFRAINEESLSRTQLMSRATGFFSLIVLAVATAHALTTDDARRAFDNGVSSYHAHNFVAARESFIAAAAADPRSPDAWANLGTASWAAADTARSVAAWQRALRLEPLAADMRERVELVHSVPWNASGWVPPVPASWVFDFAALIWCATWASAALWLL